MLQKGKNRIVRLWQLLSRPKETLGQMVAARDKSFSVFVLFVMGPVITLVWADFWSLGTHYATGQILSIALVFGPLVGICWALLLGFFGMCWGHVFDRTHRASLTYHPLIPPFPLKNLVWRKVLGMEALRRIFAWPVFKHSLIAWSWIKAIWEWLKERLGGGNMGFAETFSLVNRSLGILGLLAPILWIEIFWVENVGFGGIGAVGRPIFLVVKAVFVVYSIYVWVLAFKLAYRLSWGRALLGGCLTLLFSIGTLMGTIVFLTGIRLF